MTAKSSLENIFNENREKNFPINTMVPAIARNTIILTGSLALYGIYDFYKLLKSYKKKPTE